MVGPTTNAIDLGMGRFVRLQSPDGHAFNAYLAEPEGVARAGLIVGMEMYGVNSYLTAVCDTDANEGYLAIAPALFDRLVLDSILQYDDAGNRRGKELSAIVDHELTMLDVETAADRVRDAGKVAIMGFCFGGTVTWLAACRTGVDAAIAYYGSNMCDYPEESPRCPVICHVGDLDTAVTPEDVAAFEVRQPAVRWHVYSGAQHGFDNQTRLARYHGEAASLARERSLDFLRASIG